MLQGWREGSANCALRGAAIFFSKKNLITRRIPAFLNQPRKINHLRAAPVGEIPRRQLAGGRPSARRSAKNCPGHAQPRPLPLSLTPVPPFPICVHPRPSVVLIIKLFFYSDLLRFTPPRTFAPPSFGVPDSGIAPWISFPFHAPHIYHIIYVCQTLLFTFYSLYGLKFKPQFRPTNRQTLPLRDARLPTARHPASGITAPG